MKTVYLALGANVGDPAGHIRQAVSRLKTVLSEIRQAPVYMSRAVGYTNQPDFLNTAVSGRTDLEPEELLARLKKIEQQIGRQTRFRWGPREIDIDIIFYDTLVLDSETLRIPHPGFRERDFVLKPLTDLKPSLKDPLSGQTVTELLAGLKPEQRSIVRKVD